MAPKRVLVEKHGRHAPAPKGYVAATYDALTSPENASVVRSIAVFGVSHLFGNYAYVSDLDTDEIMSRFCTLEALLTLRRLPSLFSRAPSANFFCLRRPPLHTQSLWLKLTNAAL
ncbi:hypothetical protein IF2G_00057 [Cordyceps javanica]|nr:hypothetical protein IF2G_00057 [Cordyceps javanica]